jgi:hypothetical protein
VQLSDHHQRSWTGHVASEGHLSQLGYSLYRQAGLCTAPSWRRAEFYYQQLDALRTVRQEVRRELLAEGQKQQAWKRLCQIPSIGPIRSAVLLGILQTPHRFRTKRQLWTYSGFGIEPAPSPGNSLTVAVRFSRHSGSRASLSWLVRRCVLRAPSLTADPSLDYSRFCWRKKKRCSKRLMNTGF